MLRRRVGVVHAKWRVMRTRILAIALVMFHVIACDDKPDASKAASSGSSSASAAPNPTTAPTADAATATADDGGADGGPKPLSMPERPVPRPQTMVGSGMPIEVQQKAIAYMVAMRAPRIDDPPADPAFANDLATKLKPIAMSMDNGPAKGTMNRVEIVANGRQIDILMSGGCEDKTPMRAVTTRANTPLAQLASRGVLVVRCNDAKIQCLQSTRDPDDVLCTTAPRHK